jgi:hypothetical protein
MKVSKEFVDIYGKFNVVDQTEKMKELSRSELLLLLTLAVDAFEVGNPYATHNLTPYKAELQLLFDSQGDKKIEDDDILDLVEKTGEKIVTDGLLDQDGNKLPTPLTDEEATVLRRELGIDSIIN